MMRESLMTQRRLVKYLTLLSSDKESERYIDQIFTKLKREEKIKINTEPFKFVHVNQNIVERLIHNLNSTSGAGFSEIPSKVIKYSYSIIAPILTTLFNHCIDLNRFPIEWKSAIVTPLYKNKGATREKKIGNKIAKYQQLFLIKIGIYQ